MRAKCQRTVHDGHVVDQSSNDNWKLATRDSEYPAQKLDGILWSTHANYE